MAFNLGDLFATIKVKQEGVKEGITGLKNVGQAGEESVGKVSKLSSGLKAFAGVATAVAGLGIGAAIVSMGKAAIQGASNFEQSRVAFEVMLGSAAKAKVLMEDISKFAASTPFELPEVVAAAKKLLAYGFAQEKILGTLRMIGDVASAVGVNVGELTDIYGKARTQGVLFTEDFDQFTGRGIPMAKALSGVLKVSEDKVRGLASEGKITFDVLEKGFQVLTKEGGQFGGMMDKQSKTLAGVWSNIQDGIGRVLRGLVGMSDAGEIVENGLFDRVKQGAMSMMDTLSKIDSAAIGRALTEGVEHISAFMSMVFQLAVAVGEYLQPKFMALWSSLTNNIFPLLVRLWREVIEPLIPVIGTLLVGAIGLLIDTLTFLIGILAPVMQWMLDNKEAVMFLVGAFIALKAALMITDAINTVRAGFDVLRLATIPSLMSTIAGIGPGIMAMGGPFAIFAAAAIGAIALVLSKFNELQDTINNTNAAIANRESSNKVALQRAQQQYKEGKISKDRLNQIIKLANEALPSFAGGVTDFKGGLAFVHKDEALVNLPKGTDVIPKQDVGAVMGQSAAPAQTNQIHLHMEGVMARSRNELADIVIEGIKVADQRLRAAGKPTILGVAHG
jgi:hypothetical protein